MINRLEIEAIKSPGQPGREGDNMGEIKLKTCPYCGAPGVMRRAGVQWYVECSAGVGKCPAAPWSGYYNSQETAAEIWNRRADDAV